MGHVNVRLRAIGALAVTALALAGCGSSAPRKETAERPAATSAVPAEAPSAAPAATTAPAATATKNTEILADGRHPVYLTGLDTGASTVTFDLIEFLTGKEAEARWKKQHPNGPDGPDNDYMIVNENSRQRTMPVAAGAKCTVLASLGGVDMTTVAFSGLPAFLKKQSEGMTVEKPNLALLPFWLTVEGGEVTRFEEQFLP